MAAVVLTAYLIDESLHHILELKGWFCESFTKIYKIQHISALSL